jgi:hypothetical protein
VCAWGELVRDTRSKGVYRSGHPLGGTLHLGCHDICSIVLQVVSDVGARMRGRSGTARDGHHLSTALSNHQPSLIGLNQG